MPRFVAVTQPHDKPDALSFSAIIVQCFTSPQNDMNGRRQSRIVRFIRVLRHRFAIRQVRSADIDICLALRVPGLSRQESVRYQDRFVARPFG